MSLSDTINSVRRCNILCKQRVFVAAYTVPCCRRCCCCCCC